MKTFKRILLITFSLLLVTILGAFIILRFYEDDVVKYAIEMSKSQFNTKVEMGEVNLAFWETFPNASLEFSDVYVEETFKEHDTLFFAKSVFLEFNLFDLLRSEYRIHTVDVHDAMCRLKQNAHGEDNWHFWNTADQDTSQLSLALEEVNLESIHFSFVDQKEKLIILVGSEKFTGKGDFSAEKFELDVETSGIIYEIGNMGKQYAVNRTFELEALIHANTQDELYAFDNCELLFESIPLIVSGKVNTSEKSSVDIDMRGVSVDLEDLIASLPADEKKVISRYSPDGDMNFELSLKKSAPGKPMMTDAHLRINDGELMHSETGMSLKNISCDLRYSSGAKKDQLKINSMSCNLGIGYLQIEGEVSDLSQPVLDLQASIDMKMEDLKQFFALDTLELCQGEIRGNTVIKGKLNYVEADTSYDWRAVFASGRMFLENGRIRLKNSEREFSNLQADVIFDKTDATVDHFSGVVNGNDFNIKGALYNLIPFLTAEDERLKLDASLACNLVDFTNLVETDQTTSADNNYRFELPERIDFRLNTSINKFSFRKFNATEVKGVASYQGGTLTIDPLSFKTAGGDFTAQIAMNMVEDELYRLNCLAQFSQINISELFTEFENFDQDFIQDKHLEGVANATIQFRTALSTSLEMLPDKVESLIDISIENGRLRDLESLQDIAGYIRSNKLVAPFVNEDKFAEKMRDISFSRLENVIEINKGMITIPLMDIRSSAMDISARGTHTFDNKIDYAIGFNLRDVLVRKEKEWQETDDGLGKRLYISMKGTTDNPEFSMDKELAKEVRQEEMQAEKQNVKALLREELGLFKKDKSVGDYQHEEEETGTITTLEWEENDKTKEESTPTKTTNDKKKKAEPDVIVKKKKVPKWLEEKE